jgi:autotransporter-associated beta strand protein/T5SS/PEP-CTERM-associated repeat protein
LDLGYDETVFGKIGSLGGIGTLTVSGGGQVSQSVAYLGYANQSSGTVGISGAGSTWTAESLYLGGSDSAARGIGILNVANEGHAGVGAAMTLWATGLATVNGGTLAAGVLAGTAGTIRITDPAGDVAMTVGSTGSGDFSGSIVDDTGPGSLAKIGDGTQTLSGSNTCSGVTTIQEGTLLVNNPGSVVSPVIVKSGGTFGGTGTAASIAVSPGGHLAPGSSGVGVLTLTGNLTLDSGALLDFDQDAPAESDRILMPLSTLTLNGQQFSDFAFTAMADFGPGTYLLIDAGAIQGSGLGPNPTGTINGLRATLALGGASGNELVLNVVPEPGTLSLLGVVGIGLLASIRRRKSRGRVSNDPGDTRAAGPRTYVRGSPDDGCPLTADRLPALLDKPAVAPSAPDRLSLSAER